MAEWTSSSALCLLFAGNLSLDSRTNQAFVAANFQDRSMRGDQDRCQDHRIPANKLEASLGLVSLSWLSTGGHV
jgi:hypothetical protein